MKRCPKCRTYTLKEKCPQCGSLSENSFPPRYSPEDRFGKYRRMALYEDDNKEE
jgi:H/ACA ribonucleoprotein complex subunit 3